MLAFDIQAETGTTNEEWQYAVNIDMANPIFNNNSSAASMGTKPKAVGKEERMVTSDGIVPRRHRVSVNSGI